MSTTTTNTNYPINPNQSNGDPISFAQSFINGLQDPKFSRGGLLTSERLLAMPVLSTLLGFAIDGYSAGKMESYRYRAEHQHKKPKSIQQWYFYHKTKNYKVILQSIYSGSKMTAKLTALSSAFLGLEYFLDFVSDRKLPILSSTLSGLTTSVLVGSFQKLPLQSFKYGLLMGTGFGALTGCLQTILDHNNNNNNNNNSNKNE